MGDEKIVVKKWFSFISSLKVIENKDHTIIKSKEYTVKEQLAFQGGGKPMNLFRATRSSRSKFHGFVNIR